MDEEAWGGRRGRPVQVADASKSSSETWEFGMGGTESTETMRGITE